MINVERLVAVVSGNAPETPAVKLYFKFVPKLKSRLLMQSFMLVSATKLALHHERCEISFSSAEIAEELNHRSNRATQYEGKSN